MRTRARHTEKFHILINKVYISSVEKDEIGMRMFSSNRNAYKEIKIKPAGRHKYFCS